MERDRTNSSRCIKDGDVTIDVLRECSNHSNENIGASTEFSEKLLLHEFTQSAIHPVYPLLDYESFQGWTEPEQSSHLLQ